MKAKIKRHSRSALSVLLSLCMLVSCMTVGLIGTDAAQTLDAIGASADEASVGADLDKAEDGEESVGAAVDDDESVGDSSSVTIGYDWDGSWKTKSLSKGAEWEVTFSTSKKINFYFQDGSTYYKYDSSQQMPYDSTNQNEFRGHKNGNSDLSFTVQAATYVVKYTGTNNNDLLYFKFYRKQADYYLLYSTSDNPSNFRNTNSIVTKSGNTYSTSFVSTDLGMTQGTDYYFALSQKPSGSSGLAFTDIATNITVNATGAIGSYGQQTYDSNKYRFARINLNSSDKLSISVSVNTDTKTYSFSTSSFYTVTVIAGANGTVSVGGETIASGRSKVIEVAQGSNVSATANANNKYEFDEWVVVSPAAVSSTSSATTNISATGSGGTVTAKFKERTSSNHYKATAGSTLNNNNIYSNIKATFFDYYNDNEVIKPGDPSKWITNIGSGKGVIDPDDDGRILAYKTLNQAISDYCYNGGSNSVQYPFYFGCFFGMWNKNVNSYSPNDNQGGVGWNFYHIINDSNNITGSGAPASLTSANHSLSGLTGKTLTKSTYNTTDNTLDKTGMIHYYSASGTNQNGKAMPIFDETWLSGANSKGKELATIIDSPFPVVKTQVKTIYYQNTNNWSVPYAYAYDSGDNPLSGSWPGTPMTHVTGNIWSINVNANSQYMIFSNNGASQTGSGKTAQTTIGANDYYNGSTWSIYNSTVKVANYYKFDSTDATDNAYFKNIPNNTSNITIDYYSGKSNGVRARTYNNWGFFPFDWNNRGSSNNAKDMCFGVKLEIDFTLGAGGKINGMDQTFDFSGDDDLWVFVDGNLILDLGGDHKQSTGSINFADKTVTAAKVDNVQSKLGASAVTRNEFPSDFNNNDESVVHKMTIYYLERGMYDSNLKFGFSFVPVSSTYINEKEIDTSAVNAALKSAVDSSLTNEEFTFTHSRTTVADGEAGGGLNGTYSLLPKGTGYTLIDGASQNTRTTSSGQYTLKNTQQAKFVGLDKDRYFQITEAQSASNKWEYTTELTVWDMENTDSNGVYKTIPVTGVTNDGVTNGGKFKFLTTKSPAHETDATHILGLFTNKIQTKTLNISKVIADGVEDHESEFVIHVRVSLDGGSTFNSYDLDYTNGALKGTLSSGYVSIKNGETIKIDGIPVNAVVEVTEVGMPEDYHFNSVTDSDGTSDDIDNGKRFTVQNNKTVTFTNEKTPKYNLTVTKEVTGGDSTEYFPIYVQYKYEGGSSYEPLVDGNVSSFITETVPTDYSEDPDWYFDGTNDCFMLKAGKSFTLTGNKHGDQFIVVEDTGNIHGYTYSGKAIFGASASDYGTSDDLRGYRDITINNSDVTVTITNAVDIPTYTLKLTKTTDSDYDYTTAFKVRVQKWNGSAYVDLYTGGNESTPYYGLSGDDHNGNAVTRNALPYSTGSSTQFYYYPVRKGDVLDIPGIIDGDQIRVIEVDPDTSYYTYNTTTLTNVTNATTRSAYSADGIGKGIDFTFDASDVTSGKNLTVTINNVSVKQTVRVYKRTNFNINDGSTFQIHVKWLPYNKGGSYINKEGGVINTDAHVTSTSTTVPTIEAEGKYSLQKDEYVEFTNVPYGSTFQVEETAYGYSNVTKEQRFTFDKLTVDGVDYAQNVSLHTEEITKDTDFFVWNKIFKNDVKIKKIIDGRVTGEAHDTETEHTFSIGILRNGQGSASYNTTDDSVTYYIANAAGTEGSGVTVTEFPFTVTLKEDEEVRLHGIYSGSFFTVRETSVGFGYQYNSIEFTNVVDNDPAIEGLPNPTIDSSARSITFQTRNLGLTGSASILFKNEKRPTIKYRITYNYPSRTQFIPTKTKLYGDQQYFVEDTISGDDVNYDTYFANGNITKALVQAVAPFETNFMIDLALDNSNITIQDPVTSDGEKIYKATATFTGGETTRKRVNFILPYNYTIENHTYGKKLFQATDQNYLGDNKARWKDTLTVYPTGVPYQDDMTAWEYEEYLNDDGTITRKKKFFFTEAPSTLNNNGTTMNFLYWSIRSVNEATGQYEEVARCYDTRFNYVIFDDYEITPVYDGFASSLGYDTSGNTQSTTAKFATINLLAFSRNQWNSNVWDETQVKGNGSLETNLEGRDTVYVDFDVAFEYNNIKLKNHKTIETGILIENCGKLDVENYPLNFNDSEEVSPGKTKYRADYEHYVDKYYDNKTAMEAQLKEYLKGNIDANAYKTYVKGLYGSDFPDTMYSRSFEMLKTYNTNGSINNMNRSEIGIGNHVRVINDDGSVDTVGEWSIDNVKKNSVFRAYTYIKDAENNIILSEPVYFTVYNTAVLGGQV